MSLVIDQSTGAHVHYPRNRAMFEFDDEVASHFAEMAQRSIPLFAETHMLNARIVADHHTRCQGLSYYVPVENGEDLIEENDYTIIDLGTSTGVAFTAMRSVGLPLEDINCIGVDRSTDMLEEAAKANSEVNFMLGDLCQPHEILTPQADVVICNHVIQFIPMELQMNLVAFIGSLLKQPHGIVLIAHKEAMDDSDILDQDRVQLAGVLAEHYNRFRLDNDYSQKEIDAKTLSLRDIMQPCRGKDLVRWLTHYRMDHVEILMKWGPFASYFATAAR